ncbi:zinc finger BED domain-containing protein RICESLEEPER 3-like [Gossypium australe]|uniref:Zinc finger BED domain-containing protein RICESLEEPER 3-like n=1 Tax=Gossypium australe TaxID=47621 RepID=A0A5B6UW00_9ROSI|nr:zinc finger BED domain-containing protein RICESLEEPER 3-like [Gossypium australe]
MLRRCRSNLSHIISAEDMEIQPDLSYEEEPIEISTRKCRGSDLGTGRNYEIPVSPPLFRDEISLRGRIVTTRKSVVLENMVS